MYKNYLYIVELVVLYVKMKRHRKVRYVLDNVSLIESCIVYYTRGVHIDVGRG
jgi:hypothetical protein